MVGRRVAPPPATSEPDMKVSLHPALRMTDPCHENLVRCELRLGKCAFGGGIRSAGISSTGAFPNLQYDFARLP